MEDLADEIKELIAGKGELLRVRSATTNTKGMIQPGLIYPAYHLVGRVAAAALSRLRPRALKKTLSLSVLFRVVSPPLLVVPLPFVVVFVAFPCCFPWLSLLFHRRSNCCHIATYCCCASASASAFLKWLADCSGGGAEKLPHPGPAVRVRESDNGRGRASSQGDPPRALPNPPPQTKNQLSSSPVCLSCLSSSLPSLILILLVGCALFFGLRRLCSRRGRLTA